ncbi:MAG: hypothetical protein KJT03_03790, partial [Verrucomicrobiae bacterium]|nr:hypothetical protein [Verrucomicrobiae bacterium]
DFEGQSLKKTYEKPKETFLSKAYAYATFSNEPQLSVSQSNAKQIVANQDAFFESSLPVRFSNFVEVLPFPFSLKLSELSTDFEKNLTGFSITAAKSAYFTNNKRVIMILPDDPSIWGTKLDGLAPLGYEKVLLLRGTISLPGTVAAHEMIHSLGFVPSQTVDKGHVPEGSQVPLGFKISQASGEILKDTPDLMLGTSSSSRWISTEAYSHALAKLSKKGMDPEVIIISGTIDLSDQVEADPWYKILSDQVTEISDQGAYSITFVDKNDQVLIRHQFDPSFELNAVLSEGATGSAILQTDISGFVFAIPAQAGTRSIRIEKGEQILFERPVSLNAPVISEVSDLDRKILQSGLLEKLSWVVRDEDGDDLETSLDWSHDG